jgi:hypothetical protein
MTTATADYITLREAAERTGYTKHWIMELAKKGRVRFRVKPYGFRAYNTADLDALPPKLLD